MRYPGDPNPEMNLRFPQTHPPLLYGYMYVCMNVYKGAYMSTRMYVSIRVYMSVCMYARI